MHEPQALDPEFGGATEEKGSDLLEASVDYTAWLHTQIGVPANDLSTPQSSRGGGSVPPAASLHAV